MNKKFLKTCIVWLLTFLVVQPAYAAVYTASEIEADSKSIYVAGNPDFYPIEYYNKKTGRYEGVMPQILNDISEHTGIDFTYLHDAKTTQADFARNLQVELVSAYMTDSNENYAKDKMTVLSYEHNGKTANIGFAFTEVADEALIEKLKNQASKITEHEINGYLITASKSKPQENTHLVLVVTACCVLLTLLLIPALFNLRKLKKKLKENKMTDTETGIGNIAYFEHYFEHMISDLSRSLYYIAYIIMDSNYLQVYHGEAIFTDAVKYMASVLKSYEKENEIAARITENGFAFVFQSTNADDAKQKIREMTDKLNLYIQEENKTDRPFFHAAVYNLSQSDRNCELLLFNLRKNCNKLMGTDEQFVLVDTQMMNSATEEKRLLESIAKGFENKEFKLYIQFIVKNKTKQMVSAEALSRWDNPEKGIIAPSEYINVLESSGLITKLDYYMFELVCRQLHKWNDTEFGNLTISCNFTRITISEDDFAEKIKEIAEKYVFRKNQLIIEITEDALEKNRDIAMSNIYKCKEMGFKIALDDMGSGYTSLINLCEYPIDIVKIDRDILLKTDKQNGKDLFVGIIALAHSLGLTVVCEGVETEEQNRLVETTDCDFIQGWYYSRALPERESEEFAREYTRKLQGS